MQVSSLINSKLKFVNTKLKVKNTKAIIAKKEMHCIQKTGKQQKTIKNNNPNATVEIAEKAE